jgi:hypothetical protein
VQLFFAKVLRSANEDEVRHLFNRFGRVIEVNLFRAFQVRQHARKVRKLDLTLCAAGWRSL